MEELLTLLSACPEVIVPPVQHLLSEKVGSEKPSAEALDHLRTAEEARYQLDMESSMSEADAAERTSRHASFMQSLDAIKSVVGSELELNPSCWTSVEFLRGLVESHQSDVQGSNCSNVC